jgi:copper transport protein
VKRFTVAATLLVGALLVFASPAAAHAELVSTTPATGTELPSGEPPAAVTLEFTEGVQVPSDAVEVLDSDGATVEGVGAAEHGDTDATVVAALPELDDGTYVVNWRVVSTDSHPIQGAFTFNVGDATASADDVAGLLAGNDDHGVGIAFGFTRALAFGSVLVLLGALLFVRVCSPDAAGDAGVRGLVWVCWIVGFATAFVGIGMQAAYTSGQDFAEFFDMDAIGDVMDTRFGRAWLLRAGVLLLLLLALRGLGRPRAPVVDVVYALLGVVALATFTFAGHARTGRYVALATVTDVVHLAAAAAWLGGIAVLATLLARRTVPLDAPTATARFSRIAGPALVVVAVSGVVQAWRQTAGLDSVLDTSYGRLLLTKIGVVILIVAAASVSRHIVNLWTQRRLAPAGPGAMRVAADPEEMHELRNSVVAEVALAAVVLVVTAVLVNTTPARVDGAGATGDGGAADTVPAAGFEQTFTDNGLTLDVGVSPGLAGTNTVRVDVTREGRPFDPIEARAEMTLPERELSLDVALARAEAGQLRGTVDLPFAGTWRLELRALRTDIEQAVVEADVDIG